MFYVTLAGYLKLEHLVLLCGGFSGFEMLAAFSQVPQAACWFSREWGSSLIVYEIPTSTFIWSPTANSTSILKNIERKHRHKT